MAKSFAGLDWMVIAAYVALLTLMGWVFSRQKSENATDYFKADNSMSFWVVAVSVLATAQSAATFLGGPDQGFRGNFTYLSSNIGTIIAALFVAKVMLPKFYRLKVFTVYELLEARFDRKAMRAAGGMYLIGRIFASGSRLFMAAIAVSMILFSNIEPMSIILSSLLMIVLGYAITFLGGIKSVIWTDLIQFLIYVGSALAVLYVLWHAIPATPHEVLEGLRHAPGGQNKLKLFDFSLSLSKPFAMISVLSGMVLLSIASFGMDQDMTQRVLTCKNAKDGGRALLLSAVVAIPVVWIFISIGELLHIYYQRPDLMGSGQGGSLVDAFHGREITVFMSYILNELPAGLRGLVTVGVVAAAVSTINSGLNSMSSVMVEDFYRPWRERRGTVPEAHYVRAGQVSMALVGLSLFLMAILCYFWQQYSDMPLLDFALSVMVFAYSGLLGVYFTVLFTRRGASWSVIAALITGFIVTLLMQDYIVDSLHLPGSWKELAFSWKLCIGTAIAFLVCQLGNDSKAIEETVK